MIKFVVATVAALTLASSLASARDIPTNADECTSLSELAKTILSAEKPAPEKQAEIDALLVKLDQHCAASQYEEAMTTTEIVIAKLTEGD